AQFGRIGFFFSSRRRHTRSKRDWSSDVCSSDLTDKSGQPVAISHTEKPVFGLNFYPEKQETKNGLKILETFALDICNCAGSWTRSEERRVGKECRAGRAGKGVRKTRRSRTQRGC